MNATLSETRKMVPAFQKASYVVAFSALLNPLNASMISVGLLRIGSAFSINVAQASWLITGYFLATAIGQPVMGKLADLFGARRIFWIGLAFTALLSLLPLWATSFAWLLTWRILQAFFNTASFPAGMAILQTMALKYGINDGKIPPASMGIISITNNITAALGPVLGGFLVTYAGWRSIFWINVPIIAAVLLLFFLLVPPVQSDEEPQLKGSVWKWLDIPGVLLFSIALLSVMFFLMSISTHPRWWLIPVFLVSAYALNKVENRREMPFFHIDLLRNNRKLLTVYLQYAGSSIAFFCLFFGFPLWLEKIKGFEPQAAGLIMLPLLGFGVIATQAAVSIIARYTYKAPVTIGYFSLVLGMLLLIFVHPALPLTFILFALSIVGISNGLTNMGLQTALYTHSDPKQTGMTSGLFLTFRSLGSIFSTSVISYVYSAQVTTRGLHQIVVFLILLSLLLFASRFTRRSL